MMNLEGFFTLSTFLGSSGTLAKDSKHAGSLFPFEP